MYFTAKVILVMYSDGRLVIIYEDIPTGIDSEYLISEMKCKFDLYIEIKSIFFTL
uniref:SJCHGC06926 protein n=1 Tax=Schistosoma japonicum TaxID=6182 RepID=Q5BRZ8_SCHJA|nr:SJCHGC06926 protein [Schistosoma japonicum]